MRHRLRVGILVMAVLAALGVGGVWGSRHYSAYREHRAALRDLDRYYPAEAHRRLLRCLEVWPENASIHLLAARAARQSGDFDEAERHLVEHRRLEPEKEEERSLELALLRAQNGDLEGVEESLLARVERGDPKSPLVLEALIEGNLRMYRFVGAMSCVELWLSHEPDNPRALFLRGRAFERVGAHTKAINDFRRVVDLEPDRSEARLRLVNVLIQQGKPTDALPHLEQLRKQRPNDPEVVVRYAFARNAVGEPEEAIELLDALIADQPDYSPALLGRGQIALQLRHLPEAERWLKKALDLDPHNRQTNYVYYQCLQQQGKTKEAEAQAARLKRVEKDVIRLVEISTKEMNQKPRDPALHHEVGAIQTRMGHKELGMRWFHSAIMLDPNYRPAHASLAEYYEGEGDRVNAERHRSRALAVER